MPAGRLGSRQLHLSSAGKLMADFPDNSVPCQEEAYSCWAHRGPLLAGRAGRARDAEEVYRHGVATHEKLVADFGPWEPSYHARLAANCDALVNVVKSDNRPRQLPAVCRQAITSYEGLKAWHPGERNTNFGLFGLARHRVQLKKLFLAAKQPAEALPSLHQARQLGQALATDFPQEP
jgi:hypothetical protein